jgi:ligand-binding sensor domain-containing protein
MSHDEFENILWVSAFLSVIVSAQAQTDQYKFSQVNVDKGLTQNQIKCFLRDSKGFMWFRTISGLNQ